MSVLDVDALLAPVSDEEPCGPLMEDTQEFLALTNAAEFSGPQTVGGEESEPDWKAVKRLALDLAEQTKDIRVAINLTGALLRIEGWAGFGAGCQLVAGYAAEFWDDVHPAIEGDDHFFRSNALLNLVDARRFLSAVRSLPLVSARLAGTFSLRDIERARHTQSGRADAEEEPANGGDESWDDAEESADQSAALIQAAFNEVEIDALTATTEGISVVRDQIMRIEATVAEKLGAGVGPNLQPLLDVLQTAHTCVQEPLMRRAGIDEGADEGVDAGPESPGVGADTDAASSAASVPAAGKPLRSGAINSAEDALRAMDMVADYFRRNEPSSPVPLVMERAKRLVHQDFMSLMNDLAPDGLTQARTILGIEDEGY